MNESKPLYEQMVDKQEELMRYQKAYNILMDYFDYLPDDLRAEGHKRLDEVGL